MMNSGATSIFLHLTHLLLAIFTIVGLHMYSFMYYLHETIKHHDQWKLGGGLGLGPEPQIYWTETLWAVVVGLIGLCSLVVLIASVVIKLPQKIVSGVTMTLVMIYYVVAAILIFLIASLGLGINQGVTQYNECINPAIPGLLVPAPSAALCARFYNEGYFVIYCLSLTHVMLYGASFAHVFNDKSQCPRQSAGYNGGQQQQRPVYAEAAPNSSNYSNAPPDATYGGQYQQSMDGNTVV